MNILLTLRHDDLLPFIRRYYFAQVSWVVMSHYLFSVLFLVLWVDRGIVEGQDLIGWLIRFGLAVVGFVALVPVHEGLHGLMYWMLGAKDIRFRVSLKHSYAYAIAHRHVVSAREFVWIAIVPFLIITGFCASMISVFPGESFFILGVLVIHTAGCAGDWAMMNFVWSQRHFELYTFDDADERITYFVTGDQGER